MFDAGAGQFRLAGGARHLGRIEAVLGAAQGLGGHLALGTGLLELGGQFAGFLLEAAGGRHGALALGPGVVMSRVQCGDGI